MRCSIAGLTSLASILFVSLGLGPTLNLAHAHGGYYRGPAGVVPPTNRVPTDPTPPLPPPGPTPGGTPGAGNQGPPPGGTPSPNGMLPPAGPRLGPRDGGLPSQGRGAAATPGPIRKRTGKTAGYERWEFWWAYNRDAFLDLKERLASRGEFSGSADWLLGNSDRGRAPATLGPSQRAVRERVIPALVEALDDRFFDVRAAAAIALGKAGDAKVLANLVEALSDTHQQVSESAALAIGILGEREGLPVLRELLLDTVEGRKAVRRPQGVPARTRAFAGIGLGLVGDGRAVADLLSVADPSRREPNKDVPIGAIVGLGLLGPEASEAVAPLLELLASARVEDLVRSYAATSLGKIGDRSVVPALRRALRDSSPHVHRSAVLALGRLAAQDDTITANLLADIVEKGRDPQARNWACISLAKIGAPPAEKVLKRVATGSSSTLRAFGALGLAILHRRTGGVDGALRYLRAGLAEGGDQSVQGAFAIALGIARDREAVPDLLRLMVGQNSPSLRGFAAVSLGMMEAREAIPEIRSLATARVVDPELQRAAATALGLMGDPEAIGLLAEVIENAKTEFVMSSAALALGQIGDHTAVDTLITLLRDKENVPDLARAQATVALGLVAEDEKLPVLHAVSEDNNYRALVESIQEVLTIS